MKGLKMKWATIKRGGLNWLRIVPNGGILVSISISVAPIWGTATKTWFIS